MSAETKRIVDDFNKRRRFLRKNRAPEYISVPSGGAFVGMNPSSAHALGQDPGFARALKMAMPKSAHIN